MIFKVVSGWIEPARPLLSPNCDMRPKGVEIDLLVIHAISLPPGEFGGPWIDALFTNTLEPAAHAYFREISGLRVSSHILIRRNGEVVQYVPLYMRAWHAGQSSFSGRQQCNDFSIGIELEGSDDQPYEAVQYHTLVAVTHAVIMAYPAIRDERIVGHSDIAPGRKTDPGPYFDWLRYRALLACQAPVR